MKILSILKNNLFIILFCFTLFSCRSTYDAGRVYFNDETELLKRSETLSLKVPLRIDFSGTFNNNSKDYRINGLIKIETLDHYQLFLFSKTFGIEICRIDINEGQIIFIDKMNKSFYKGNIENFKYFNNTKLNGKQYLLLIIGRNIVDINILKNDTLNSYTYNKNGFAGNIVINNFGFLKQHIVEANEFKFDLNFGEYSNKTNIPMDLNGKISLSSLNFLVYLNFISVKSDYGKLEELMVPNNFKEIL